MANMFDTAATCSSSSSPPEPTDDISLFLRQILLKSSTSSSSTSLAAKQMQCEIQRQHPLQSSGLPFPDPIHTFSSPAAAYFPANAAAAHVSSSSVGTLDNDLDDYDCDSEEGFENLMEEMAAKPNPPRNPSKRSRAAEVHNLSEKRRRSRINEKMKALQKLIPNSNKTDKASMLDEAIEYLKQLQLQVQMLTMRNGINLYSMCVPPGVLQQNQLPQSRMGSDENGSVNANMTAALAMSQEALANPILSVPMQRTNQSQPSVSDFSHIINPDPSFRLEPSLGTQHGSFQFPKEFCREGMLSRPRTDVNSIESNSSDFQMGTNGSSQGHQSKGAQLMNSQRELILPLDLDGSHPRNESFKDVKSERMPF